MAEPSGALRFARFAFRPNALRYCGGESPGELFEHVVEGVDAPDLRRLCGEFAGARPYLELLAEAPEARGPLDGRVVEAYWVGGELLDRIGPRAFGDDLARRFRRPVPARARRALGGRGGPGRARRGPRRPPRISRGRAIARSASPSTATTRAGRTRQRSIVRSRASREPSPINPTRG